VCRLYNFRQAKLSVSALGVSMVTGLSPIAGSIPACIGIFSIDLTKIRSSAISHRGTAMSMSVEILSTAAQLCK